MTTILTPKYANTSAHQAATATAELAKYREKVQADEVHRKACPVPGAVLSSWQPPAEYGRIVDRTPTRIRGIPAEALWFEKQRVPVIRLTVKLHGIDG
jgi:hypothetical protein